MSAHLTYLEAVVTGLVQGVTELFPVSSLGHNVLIPALIGGSWANALNVSASNSPYLAFIVGLHVATAIAMIAYFWRDWLRIVRGFISSLRTRSVTTPDERLAWMIILGTIPVGLVGLVLQKEVTKVLAKPELAAFFLAVNGVILLVSERMRRSRDVVTGGAAPVSAAAGPVGAGGPAVRPGGPGWGDPRVPGGPGVAGGPGVPSGPRVPGAPGGRGQGWAPGEQGGGWAPGGRPGAGEPGPEGWSEQPRQQQWQGPDPRYGQDDDPEYPGDGTQGQDGYGRQQRGRNQYGQPEYGQPQQGQDQYGQNQYGQNQYGRPQGQDQYGQSQPQFSPRQPGQPQYGPPPPAQPQHRQPEYGQPQQGQPEYGQDQYARGGQPGPQEWQPLGEPTRALDPRDPRVASVQRPPGRPAHAAGRSGHSGHARHSGPAGGQAPSQRGVDGAATDPAVAADRRLSTMGYKRAVIVGGAQILALLPGISRDGIVTVAGMQRGLTRQDAVRYSFLLSAPVILAAGALKAKDLTGPLSAGIHGPIIVGSLISGIGAYLSIRFLTKYFSEDKSLNPFGIYCLIAGLGSLAYLVLK